MKTGSYVTLKDIANCLGLSANAVSKALRGDKDISEATKKLVKEKAEELGYIRNDAAGMLREGNTKLIGIIFNDFYNPYFALINALICKEIQETKYEFDLMYFCKPKLEFSDLNKIMSIKHCAIISLCDADPKLTAFLRKKNIPYTTIGFKTNDKNVDTFYTDDYSGASLVAHYFNNKKFKNALYISDSLSENNQRRFNGFNDNILTKCQDIQLYDHYKVLELAVKKIVSDNIDFVFCYSDSLAIDLESDLMNKANYSKPVFVFGFDNLHKDYHLIKKINSVGSNNHEIVKSACETLIEKIQGTIDIDVKIDKMFPCSLFLK